MQYAAGQVIGPVADIKPEAADFEPYATGKTCQAAVIAH